MQQSYQKIIWSIIAILGIGTGVLMIRRHLVVAPMDISDLPVVKSEKTPVHILPATIMIHLAGAVQRPGVYEVTANIRVLRLLNDIGGILPNADLDKVKLASRVKDGQRILIPFLKAPKKAKATSAKANSANSIQIISINSASLAQWVKLPGIGPKTAKTIIEYRQKNGAFSSIDQLNTLCWDYIEAQLDQKFRQKGGKMSRAYAHQPHNISHLIAIAVHALQSTMGTHFEITDLPP